jgi:hypothetical protein
MKRFISEDDLSSFEGWLSYQAVDPATFQWDTQIERPGKGPLVLLREQHRPGGLARYAASRSAFGCVA